MRLHATHHTRKQFLCVTCSASSSVPLENPEKKTENQRASTLYTDAIILHLFPIQKSAPNEKTAACAKKQVEDSEALVRVAQKLPEKIPNDDDLMIL